MAHRNFEPDEDVLGHIRRLFLRVGDTRVIECTNGKIRHRYKDATTDYIGPMEIYRTMSLDDVLTERGLSTLDPTSAEMTLSAPPSDGWAKTLQPHLSNCPDGGKGILDKAGSANGQTPRQ